MKNLKRNWLVVLKLTWGIWQILTRALKSLNNSHFNGLLLTKYMFELKKCRGVIFRDTEEWCQIWRKTDLWLGKKHGEFGKFSSEHLKVSKLGLWWDPSIQSRKYTSLKFTDELWRMMKNLKSNRLVVSKLAWGIWLILTRALKNLKNLNFHGLLLTNVYKI